MPILGPLSLEISWTLNQASDNVGAAHSEFGSRLGVAVLVLSIGMPMNEGLRHTTPNFYNPSYRAPKDNNLYYRHLLTGTVITMVVVLTIAMTKAIFLGSLLVVIVVVVVVVVVTVMRINHISSL